MTKGFKGKAKEDGSFRQILFSFEGAIEQTQKELRKQCGDNSEEVTPVPIPNTEVKLLSADDTWWETAWESRTLPFWLKKKFAKAGFFFYICTGQLA